MKKGEKISFAGIVAEIVLNDPINACMRIKGNIEGTKEY